MRDFIIRRLNKSEVSLLKEFTYLAVYVPQGVIIPPKSIVELPELRVYYQDFGKQAGDVCLVAEADNKIVGAVWTRIVNDFAHIDDNTPSLAIAVAKESRGKGVGTRLLNKMLDVLKDRLRGKENLSIGLYYDVPSRRFYTNEKEYDFQYKWDDTKYTTPSGYVDRDADDEFPGYQNEQI